MTILVLGGTTEATALIKRLPPPFILSLAGRTEQPVLPACPYRIGGFGGVDGLAQYLKDNNIRALVDATHPFATQMSMNAAIACKRAGVSRLVFTRKPWQPQAGDSWQSFATLNELVAGIGDSPKRVLLTLGRLHLAAFLNSPQHHYIIRSIDAPEIALPRQTVIRARPPFSLAGELDLIKTHGIECIVSKNSGGKATEAKLTAARQMRIPVLLWQRPPLPSGDVAYSLEAALHWLQAHGVTP